MERPPKIAAWSAAITTCAPLLQISSSLPTATSLVWWPRLNARSMLCHNLTSKRHLRKVFVSVKPLYRISTLQTLLQNPLIVSASSAPVKQINSASPTLVNVPLRDHAQHLTVMAFATGILISLTVRQPDLPPPPPRIQTVLVRVHLASILQWALLLSSFWRWFECSVKEEWRENEMFACEAIILSLRTVVQCLRMSFTTRTRQGRKCATTIPLSCRHVFIMFVEPTVGCRGITHVLSCTTVVD